MQPIALLTKEAAIALKAASDELVRQGYRLKIYDAYRPQRAVEHFVRWAENIIFPYHVVFLRRAVTGISLKREWSRSLLCVHIKFCL